MPTTPIVSVLMTAYNRERHIAEAIDSVLASTFKDFELIIVDDRSQDKTLVIARDYERKDPRVSVYHNDINLGDYPNRNRAASFARGEYLKYVDSDDVIYPHGLEVMVRSVASFPEAGFGLSALWDSAGPYPRLLQPRDSFRDHFLVGDLFGRSPGSAIIRRDSFEKVGGFSEAPYVGDQDLWFRMAALFSLVKMPRDLYWTRTHADQQTVYEPAETIFLRNSIIMKALEAADCPLSLEERQQAILRLREAHAREFWSLVANRGNSIGPLTYKRRLSLSTSHLVRFVLTRLVAAARHKDASS